MGCTTGCRGSGRSAGGFYERFVRAALFRSSKREKSFRRFEATGLRIKRSQSPGELARRGFRKLLVGLAMVPRMEVSSSTCRVLHARTLDKDRKYSPYPSPIAGRLDLEAA